MSRQLSNRLKSRKLWQRLGIFLLIAAPVGIFLLSQAERSEAVPQPITAPHPIATTTQVAPNAFMGINLTGQAAIVYDLTTGQTLYAENAERQLPLASLTKLLTVYAGATMLGQGAQISISSTSLAAEGDNNFYAGEIFTFSELARFALVGSSNDAAEAIAEAVAARRATTLRDSLAAAAGSAGLAKTYAVNGSGLDISTAASGGYGSARDMAVLAGALVKASPRLAEATTQGSVTIRSVAGEAHSLPNTNQGAASVPGIMLSKTGFTDLAGGNLAVVVDVGIGHPVAIVVLGSTREGRFQDVNRLLNATQQYFTGIPQ